MPASVYGLIERPGCPHCRMAAWVFAQWFSIVAGWHPGAPQLVDFMLPARLGYLIHIIEGHSAVIMTVINQFKMIIFYYKCLLERP